MKGTMHQRETVSALQPLWSQMQIKFQLGAVYKLLADDGQRISWINLIHHNIARPRAIFTLWQACHKKLATRDRLRRFGLLAHSECSFCPYEETHEHLFFECEETKKIWKAVLLWIQIDHEPCSWRDEMHWLVNKTKGKGKLAALIRLAIAETVYNVWRHRNDTYSRFVFHGLYFYGFFSASIEDRRQIHGIVVNGMRG
ncbi:uncharacterized protein LOC131641910 [Vicia villosa]|uniref:uncharacterized protein LOC131641910 n=1 Tax=Vicia villosa TaxID=3911 RepID=UPI00273BB377|nr:uncharacterized protein LOC131641910 [Vicia villosa]